MGTHEIMPAEEGHNGIMWAMVEEKGAAADAASKEAQRIEGELENAIDEIKTPDEESARATIARLMPEYQEALAKERAAEDEWVATLEKYSRP